MNTLLRLLFHESYQHSYYRDLTCKSLRIKGKVGNSQNQPYQTALGTEIKSRNKEKGFQRWAGMAKQ